MRRQTQSKFAINFVAVFSAMVISADGHGRMLDPPSRSSAWREGFPVPRNPNDSEGFCGGYERQWQVNDGKCGICGDPFDETVKPNEAPGGVFATGTIVRNYTEGQVIPVKIYLTAMHHGYFEFKICANDNVSLDPPQSCFDSTILNFVNSTVPFTKYYVIKQGSSEVNLQLPPGLTCRQCILQWTYITGNHWGTCSNGTQRLGCGRQETFRACSDIGVFPAEGKFLVPDVIEPVTTTMAPMSMTPIMIPTKKPSAANTLSKCSSYIPVDSQKNMYGMTKWCNKNCRRGYCPSSYCMCIP